MIGPAGFMAGPQERHDEFEDCESCTHCVTINDDMDNLCTLTNRVVWAVCADFEHFEGKTRATHEAEALGDKGRGEE